ncbi:MAG: fenitrothion hydrolase [Solirubrobacterales bacterium]|nr:fenitrothion hydrolase [Solirubrobacterales bacterium]
MRAALVRALGAAGLASATLAVLGPATASAHGLVGRQDLPIPRWLFAWAAAVVLVISFVALATLWPKPRLEHHNGEGRRLLAVPRLPAEIVLGTLGVLAFAVTVYAGLAGTQTETANLTPTVVYVIFWIGIPILSLLFGDVFRAVSPWRAIGRVFGTLAKRVGGDALPEPLAYPEKLGRWPAAAGILVFAWVELVYSGRNDPSQLAVMALAYAAVQLVGMSLYGVQAWTERADAFGVAFNLYGRIGPLHFERGVLRTRPFLGGLPSLQIIPGTVALLCVMIGTTSFDGFSQGPTWSDLAPDLQRLFVDLGFSQEHALEAAFTVGLVLIVLAIAGLYRLGIAGMRSVGGTSRSTELGGRFVHTLVPIALAYVIAHYVSLLLYQGQAVFSLRPLQVGYLASDPLGDGSNYFGTADHTIDYGIITATGIWYVQVAALVLGHAAGLVLAHDRALALYRKPRDATRSQYWMLAIMVGFTSLGLWLLSAQSQ